MAIWIASKMACTYDSTAQSLSSISKQKKLFNIFKLLNYSKLNWNFTLIFYPTPHRTPTRTLAWSEWCWPSAPPQGRAPHHRQHCYYPGCGWVRNGRSITAAWGSTCMGRWPAYSSWPIHPPTYLSSCENLRNKYIKNNTRAERLHRPHLLQVRYRQSCTQPPLLACEFRSLTAWWPIIIFLLTKKRSTNLAAIDISVDTPIVYVIK